MCEYLIDYVSADGAPEKALANPDHHFLIGAMAYYECCTAFIVDQPKSVLEYLYPFSRPTETTYIHMFAGISLPLFVTLARTGICIRQKKTLRNMAALGWSDRDAYQSVASEVLRDAIELEKRAIDYTVPADETFDTQTLTASTYRQIKAFAQMCKFSILLELRRNFPSLMSSQPEEPETSNSSTGALSRDIKLDRCLLDLTTAALSHARDIPEGSTCGLYQTLLLIICGSVLRSSKDLQAAASGGTNLRDKLDAQILASLGRPHEIEKQRAFVRRRLQTNCASFGLRRVYSRAEMLLENVWKEFDSESQEFSGLPANRHWIDCMAEQKLETFFG
jgi:hypothetical protein